MESEILICPACHEQFLATGTSADRRVQCACCAHQDSRWSFGMGQVDAARPRMDGWSSGNLPKRRSRDDEHFSSRKKPVPTSGQRNEGTSQLSPVEDATPPPAAPVENEGSPFVRADAPFPQVELPREPHLQMEPEPAAWNAFDGPLEPDLESTHSTTVLRSPAMSPPIAFGCPGCGLELHVTEELCGEVAECPNCLERIVCPNPTQLQGALLFSEFLAGLGMPTQLTEPAEPGTGEALASQGVNPNPPSFHEVLEPAPAAKPDPPINSQFHNSAVPPESPGTGDVYPATRPTEPPEGRRIAPFSLGTQLHEPVSTPLGTVPSNHRSPRTPVRVRTSGRRFQRSRTSPSEEPQPGSPPVSEAAPPQESCSLENLQEETPPLRHHRRKKGVSQPRSCSPPQRRWSVSAPRSISSSCRTQETPPPDGVASNESERTYTESVLPARDVIEVPPAETLASRPGNTGANPNRTGGNDNNTRWRRRNTARNNASAGKSQYRTRDVGCALPCG